jgi:hypothetical protein
LDSREEITVVGRVARERVDNIKEMVDTGGWWY